MKTLFKIKIYHISGLLWKRGRPLSKWLSVACPLDSSRNSFTTLFVHMLKMSPGNRAKQIFYKIKCYSKFASNKGLFSSQNFEVAARKIVCEQQAEIKDNFLQTRTVFCFGSPRAAKHFFTDVAIKPRTPTSIVMKSTVYFFCRFISDIRGRYFVSLRIFAFSIPWRTKLLYQVFLLCNKCQKGKHSSPQEDQLKLSSHKYLPCRVKKAAATFCEKILDAHLL